MNTYPHHAGWKEADTSRDAAHAIEDSGKAGTLRSEVLRVLRLELQTHRTYSMTQWTEGMTADEIAAELGESPFSIRPRCTELLKQGKIEWTGERRKSSNGRLSKVWRLV